MPSLYLLLIPVVLVVWTAIHEMSHFIMAKALMGAKLISMKLWPHVDPAAGFRWGSVLFTVSTRSATPKRMAAMYFAPRVPGVLAAAALPFAFAAPGIGCPLLSMFLMGGVVDTCVGSVGLSPMSDLRKGTEVIGGLWAFRVAGFLVVTCSGSAWCATSLKTCLTALG